MYNFKEIEKKWQDKWYNEKSFKAIDFPNQNIMFYMSSIILVVIYIWGI